MKADSSENRVYQINRNGMKGLRGFMSAVCLLLLATLQNVSAKITLPAVFSDGMVLQQQSEVAIWGSSDKKNARIKVHTSWDGKDYAAKADAAGKWKIKVSTPQYGGPFEVSVSDGEELRIQNVLIGEVWVCSGQSNMNMNMKGNYFARKLHQVLKVPVGIIHASYGGSRVEAWMSKEGVAPYKGQPEVRNECILYNGMLSPVVGYGIRGCLWYQGEANVDAPDLYMQLFPAMVADWRAKWGIGEFPFYYAQIAPNHYNKGEGKGKNSAYLREAQLKCLDLIPASGMVVLMDLGDPHTIHPMEKEPVGNRFAYMALGKTYGKKGFPTTGPLYQSMQVKENSIEITFREIGKRLTSYRRPLDGFEIAGEDQVFHPAKARMGKDAQTVIVSSPDVEHPVAVRYAFQDYVKGSLFNMVGLPASSFRTDNW